LSEYRAPWWLPGGHVQTIVAALSPAPRVEFTREAWETPDGDFIEIDRAGAPGAGRLLVLFHGLEGSSQSHYARAIAAEVLARGWAFALPHFRGCSGKLNRRARAYHSGDSDEADWILRRFAGESGPCVAAGISLGGNVLLKWLGEQGDAAPKLLRAAVAISVPFDLERCARVMDQGFQKAVYTASFMRSFRVKTRAKALAHPGFVDLEAALTARTFAAYDRAVTAPLHGFADEVDYWQRASSGPYLGRIRRPTLLINAVDDPFIPRESLPDPATLPDCLQTDFVRHGGHVGFVEGPPWRTRSWAERRAVEYLASVLELGAVC
jgi:hypothetical protein